MNAPLQTQSKATAKTSVATISNWSYLQRKCACGSSAGVTGECEDCKRQKFPLQRSTRNPELDTRDSEGVPPIVHEVLRSPGEPLDAETRAFMEPRFGHDFSRVRIHADGRAAESAGMVNAKAYTVGREIVFAAGQFQPGTRTGQHLLTHELTHVAQQAPGQSSPAGVSSPGDHAEREADSVAAAIMMGGAVSVTPLAGTPFVQRQDNFRLPPLPSFQLRTPGLLRPPGRRLSLLTPDEQLPQTSEELKRRILSMSGVTNVRPLSTPIPHLNSPEIPPPNLLIPPTSGDTPESGPGEVEKIWDLEFELDVAPDSALQHEQERMDRTETIMGEEAQDTPLELQLANTAVNLLGAIPAVRAARERFNRALRIDSLTIIANPVPGQETFGLSVRFRLP
jgi:Domain of unknown function (DUF4157)